MELVDGETLQSLLRRIGTLPAGKALDIARQLCAGLAAAHDRGVLHRDLKPSNIMVDGRGRIRIMDFGLALRSGEWTIGEIAGTPAYMAPEQMDGARVTEQTDIYALGLVLYELYAGRRLFPVQTSEERDRIGHDTQNAQVPPGVDPEIERIIKACLENDPSKRPPSALAIAARLPGGDSLTAAIAEGAVLSPEMVAAAGPRGALHPAQAWALLGGILVGTLAILSGMLRAHHVPIAIAELEWLLFTAGLALLWGGFAWLIYISLEPHLRRVWPRTLISWTRLLSGQVRDPLVGRVCSSRCSWGLRS